MSELVETYRGMIYPWHCDHMAVQQNITYRRELLAGDTLAVRSAFLEVRERAASRRSSPSAPAASCAPTSSRA